jgi:hypothetical protein
VGDRGTALTRKPAWVLGKRETGATGLEPATSGVTGRESGRMGESEREREATDAAWLLGLRQLLTEAMRKVIRDGFLTFWR